MWPFRKKPIPLLTATENELGIIPHDKKHYFSKCPCNGCAAVRRLAPWVGDGWYPRSYGDLCEQYLKEGE